MIFAVSMSYTQGCDAAGLFVSCMCQHYRKKGKKQGQSQSCEYCNNDVVALFNPETSILIQKRHPYTGNLVSEKSGDSKNAFLHCGDVLAMHNS